MGERAQDEPRYPRRRFMQGVGAAAAFAALRPHHAGAEEAKPSLHPLPDTYLETGIMGMARSGYEDWHWVRTPPGGGQEDRTGVFNAHWGAAVISAYYMLKEIPVEQAVATRMRNMLDVLVKKKAKYFEPFPKEKADKAAIEEIPRSIIPGAPHWRAHGHPKIFAAHAVRALRDRPDLAQPKIIRGIVKIAETTDRSIRAPRIVKSLQRPYTDDTDIVDTTFAALFKFRDLKLGPVGSRPTPERFPRANFVHWLTHTDALIGLRGLGYGDIAKRGHPALRYHLARERHPPAGIERVQAPEKRLGVAHLLSMDFWKRYEAEKPG